MASDDLTQAEKKTTATQARASYKRPDVGRDAVVDKNRLHDLYGAQQAELAGKLQSLRQANVNADAKGDASERVRNDLLQGHVPHGTPVARQSDESGVAQRRICSHG